VKTAKADAILQVKENQKTLLEQCRSIVRDYPIADVHRTNEKGHGRIDMRTANVSIPPKHKQEWLERNDWHHIKAIVEVNRIRKIFNTKEKKWETSTEQSFYISTILLSAEEFNNAIRDHWGIENRNHHVRDVSMNEDCSRIRKNPQIFAKLRSLSLNVMRINGAENIASELYKNSLSPAHVLQYRGLFS
jgi:predicted transposase YbfD/YdcC